MVKPPRLKVMRIFKHILTLFEGRRGSVFIAVLIVCGFSFVVVNGTELTALTKRTIQGLFLGQHQTPFEEGIGAEIEKRLTPPNTEYRYMTMKHIPAIKAGQRMPHPYVGACTQCHLYVGGPGPGNQYKTPVGAALEEISKNVRKMGPPLPPNSEMPHPPAGRCIKCHDIVVKVPLEKPKDNGFKWF
ncbi:magnetosome protein MamT [Terasakiella sp. SH-1]|uniref:magnetosome protein MamT n=1 Tax=Terasakiella sp. SH-1 TaxID=2560057 RepID=UPI001F0DE071|nr:magnetosome protein MamT [Terasakiella sp. SH-1]